MSSPSEQPSRESLWSLARMTMKGAITADQRKRLEAVMRDDPNTRRFFLEYLQNHFSNPSHADVPDEVDVQAPVEAPDRREDLWSLCEMKCDGAMSPQQQQRFDSIMFNNPSARLFYQAYTGQEIHELPAATEALWELMSSLCDQTITDAQMQQLEAILAGSMSDRQHFLAYMDQHSDLRWRVRGNGTLPSGDGA